MSAAEKVDAGEGVIVQIVRPEPAPVHYTSRAPKPGMTWAETEDAARLLGIPVAHIRKGLRAVNAVALDAAIDGAARPIGARRRAPKQAAQRAPTAADVFAANGQAVRR